MKVEIYGSAESHTVRGATVNFNADSVAPVTELVAEVNPNGFDGRTGVDINKNGTAQSVAFGKTCYGGSANVTTGTLTEEYGGGAYDPQNVPAEVKSEVESKLTLETATPGDIVSFDCELGEYPLNSLSFPLAPIQDLHGYDSPWPAGGGKNKLKITATSTTVNGIAYTVNEDGTIVANGTASGDSTFVLASGRGIFDLDSELILNGSVGGFGNNVRIRFGTSNPSVSYDDFGNGVTIPQISDLSTRYAYVQITILSGTTVSNIVFKPMIRLASVTDATYSPYSNICPISGRTGLTVYRTGKNLNPNQGNQFTTYNTSAFLLKAGTYTFSTSDGTALGRNNAIYFQLLDENNNVITNGNISSTDLMLNSLRTFYFGGQGKSSFSFDLLVDAYVRMGFNNQLPSATYSIQLELGSAPTTYEPYNGNTYAVDWSTQAGTVYGGTLDVTNGTMTVEWGMYTYNGSEDGWIANQASQYGVAYFRNIGFYTEWAAAILPGEAVVNNFFLSNMGKLHAYQWIDGNATTPGQYGLAIGYGLRAALNGLTPDDITLAEWKTWLASNPIQLLAKLKNPVTITLDPVTISTISGQTNNVWSDTGEISELKYYDGDIADTDIQTENGVLVTGDKLFYALSSPRTSSFTPTAVNTVQGKNTMSANTGNIAVTYTSNWFDITPWIAWQGLTFSRNDVDAPNAGRDMSGYMHRGRVASKEKMNIQTVQLTRAQSSKLQTLLFPETIMVRVTPYPRTNGMQVLYMYSNNVKTTYVIHRESGEDLQSLSFPLIEN